MRNSILHQIYIFHRSYIFSFNHQNRVYKNQKFNFPAKIYEIRKNGKEKNVHFKEIYKFANHHFFIGVISFVHYWKMLLKIKTFSFKENYPRYKNNVRDKIIHLKKIYSDHFLIGYIVSVLIVKNAIKVVHPQKLDLSVNR